MGTSYTIGPEQGAQLISQWKASARLQREFGGSFDVFLAFVNGAVSGAIRNRSLPFELQGIFEGVPCDSPPRNH